MGAQLSWLERVGVYAGCRGFESLAPATLTGRPGYAWCAAFSCSSASSYFRRLFVMAGRPFMVTSSVMVMLLSL